MSLDTHQAFQEQVFRALGFAPAPCAFGTRWSNAAEPARGSCHVCQHSDSYSLTVADYHVTAPFSLDFHSTTPFLRFSSFYEGDTDFHINGVKSNASSPVSFLVKEHALEGRQFWRTGTHCRGVELALSLDFLRTLTPLDPNLACLEALPVNTPHNILPPQTVALLREMAALSAADALTPLQLQGMVLQALAQLADALANRYFIPNQQERRIIIGKRNMVFSEADHQAIHLVRALIDEHPEKKHTVASLSRQVFLSEQKLKAGFALCYHTTVGAYLKERRMALAAELLVNTDRSIYDIAQVCGYGSSASFIKAFRQHYKTTPVNFRTQKSAQEHIPVRKAG